MPTRGPNAAEELVVLPGVKVLFVDDERRVLDAIERSLLVARVDWDVAFATSGESALVELETGLFDVVVSDIRMPGPIDGVKLLQLAQERQPGVARLVLSGQVDEASSLRIAQFAHQFLAKPCDMPTVRRVVSRVQECRRLLPLRWLTLVTGIDRLPCSARIGQEVSALLARDDATLDAVVALLSQDPGLAAKLLQLVNSAFFAGAREITETAAAARRLGMKVTRQVLLGVGDGAVNAPNGVPSQLPQLEALQRRAFDTARLARSAILDPKLSEVAYTCGLLCDVGELVLTAHGGRDGDSEVVPANVVASLLGLWGLPPRLVRAPFCPDTPELSPELSPDCADAQLDTALWLAATLATGREPDPLLVKARSAEPMYQRVRRTAERLANATPYTS